LTGGGIRILNIFITVSSCDFNLNLLVMELLGRSPLSPINGNSIGGVSSIQKQNDGKGLIRGFYNSPVDLLKPKKATKSTSKVLLSPSSSSVLDSDKNKHCGQISSSKSQYDITFPVGSMGLELEPVIISTERRLGCRVRDFYFAQNHQGIRKSDVKKLVQPGDIIASIQGKSVISVSFEKILEELISLKSQVRVVGFKNIGSNVTTPSKAVSSSTFLLDKKEQVKGKEKEELELHHNKNAITPVKLTDKYTLFDYSAHWASQGPSVVITPNCLSPSKILSLSQSKDVKEISSSSSKYKEHQEYVDDEEDDDEERYTGSSEHSDSESPSRGNETPPFKTMEFVNPIIGVFGKVSKFGVKLGKAAEMLVGSDISNAVDAKSALLNELSQSVVQLGQTEREKEHLEVSLADMQAKFDHISSRLKDFENADTRNIELVTQISALISERDLLIARLDKESCSGRRLAVTAAAAVQEAELIMMKLESSKEESESYRIHAQTLESKLARAEAEAAEATAACAASSVIADDVVTRYNERNAIVVDINSCEVQTDLISSAAIGIQVDNGDALFLQNALKDVARLQSELEESKKANTGLQSELTDSITRYNTMAEELEEGAVCNEVLRLTLADTQGDLGRVRQEAISLKSQADRLARERDSSQEILSIRDQECENFKVQLDSIHSDRSSLQTTTLDEMSRMSAAQRALRRELDAALASSAEQIKALETGLDAAKKEASVEKGLRKSCEIDTASRITELTQQNELYDSRCQGLQAQLLEVSGKVDQSERDRNDAISDKLQAEHEASLAQAEIVGEKAENARLRVAVAEALDSSIQAKDVSDVLSHEKMQLERDIKDLQNRLNAMKVTFDETAVMEKELANARAELLTVKSSLGKAQSDCMDMSAALKKAESSFYKRVADVDKSWRTRLHDNQNASDVMCSSLKIELASARDERDAIRTKTKSMVSVLEEQMTSLQNEHILSVTAGRKERDKLVSAFENRIKELAAVANDATKVSGEKHKQLESLKITISRDSSAVEELSDQLSIANSEIANLKSEVRILKRSAYEAMNDSKEWHSRCDTAQISLAESEEVSKKLADEIILLRREFEEEKVKCANTKLDSDGIRRDLSTITKTLTEAKTKLSNAEVKSSQLTRALEDAESKLAASEMDCSLLNSRLVSIGAEKDALLASLSAKRAEFTEFHCRLTGLLGGGSLNTSLCSSARTSPSHTPIKAPTSEPLTNILENVTDVTDADAGESGVTLGLDGYGSPCSYDANKSNDDEDEDEDEEDAILYAGPSPSPPMTKSQSYFAQLDSTVDAICAEPDDDEAATSFWDISADSTDITKNLN